MDPNIRAFSVQFDSFMDKLSTMFPNEKKIGAYHESFNIFKKANPRLAINKFYDTLKPYEEKIKECDESFFLESEISENYNKKDDLLYIKSVFLDASLDQVSKKAMWDYLNVLYLLSSRVEKR